MIQLIHVFCNGVAMHGTTRTDNDTVSPLFVSRLTMATSTWWFSWQSAPKVERLMSFFWHDFNLKVFARDLVTNDL